MPGRQLQDALRHVGIVRRFYYLDHVSSTQDRARNLVSRTGGSPDLDGTLIVAEHQTAGRGRLGRSWDAPPGLALLFSLILARKGSNTAPPLLPTAAPVAVAEGVADATGLAARVKFPNDVLIAGRKVAGILIEQAGAAQRDFLIAGIGVNVNQTAEQLPDGARQTPTSLAIEAGRAFERARILAAILTRLGSYWTSPDLGRAAARMNALCDTVGHVVEIRTPTGTVHGTALSVSDDGALIVLTESGLRRPVYAGDVSLLSTTR